MTTWLFPATRLLLWFPVLIKALRAQGHLHLFLSLPRGSGCPCQKSALVQCSTCLGQGCVRERAVENIHGTAQMFLLLVSVLSLVLCYLDPDITLRAWCPASAGQTCLVAGDLPGSLGCQVILGTPTGPALLFLVGLCGPAALVQPYMPCCHPSSHPATRPGCSQTKSVSEQLCCPSREMDNVWYACWELWSLWEVDGGLAACLLAGLLASRKREQYRWCFYPQY